MTASHMQFEAYHQTAGERVSDMLASLALKEGQLISGRAYMRPSIYRDVKSLSNTRRLNAKVNRYMDDMSNAVNQEIRMKVNSFKQSARPIRNLIDNVAEDVNQKLDATYRMYERLYANNEFYVADITDAMWNAYLITAYQMDQLRYNVEEKTAKAARYVVALTSYTLHRMYMTYENFESKMEELKVGIIITLLNTTQ